MKKQNTWIICKIKFRAEWEEKALSAAKCKTTLRNKQEGSDVRLTQCFWRKQKWSQSQVEFTLLSETKWTDKMKRSLFHNMRYMYMCTNSLFRSPLECDGCLGQLHVWMEDNTTDLVWKFQLPTVVLHLLCVSISLWIQESKMLRGKDGAFCAKVTKWKGWGSGLFQCSSTLLGVNQCAEWENLSHSSVVKAGHETLFWECGPIFWFNFLIQGCCESECWYHLMFCILQISSLFNHNTDGDSLWKVHKYLFPRESQGTLHSQKCP